MIAHNPPGFADAFPISSFESAQEKNMSVREKSFPFIRSEKEIDEIDMVMWYETEQVRVISPFEMHFLSVPNPKS